VSAPELEALEDPRAAGNGTSRGDAQGIAPPPPPRIRDLRMLPRQAKLLLAGVAINRAGSFVPVFLALYITALGISPVKAGIALTCYGAGGIAGIVAGGSIADRLGPRVTIVASMLATALLVGALAALHAYLPILLASAGSGFAGAIFRPAATDLLARLTPRERLVLVSAAQRVALNVGATVGPLLGGLLASRSYSALFLVDAATCLGFALVAWKGLAPERGEAPRRMTPGGYWVVLADRRYTCFLIAMLTIAVVEVQYIAALPLALSAEGISTTMFTTLVALNGLLVILLELPLTRVTQTWPMRRAITLGVALIALGLSLYGIDYAVVTLLAVTVLWTLGEIVAAPSANAYPALIAPAGLRGRYVAAATASQSLGFAVGPALGAAVFAAGGAAVWAACALVGAFAVTMSAAGVREPVIVTMPG
jgi:MFS family permease